MTLSECRSEAVGRLAPLYGVSEAKWLVREIFLRVKGWGRVDMAMRSGDTLSDFIVGKVDEAVSRLLRHEPIQYIFGVCEFYGLQLRVTPDVLIPRPETAELVDMVVHDTGARSDLRVLDVCTGSGCIAVALARNLKFPQVSALDCSGAALAVARRNASSLKVKVDFVQDDALNLVVPQEPCYDIVVSNPPYIAERERAGMDANVLEYEPAVALFVPDDNPIVFYKEISAYAMGALHDGGRLYFEVNPHYASELKRWLEREGWLDVRVSADMQKLDRFITAIRPRR